MQNVLFIKDQELEEFRSGHQEMITKQQLQQIVDKYEDRIQGIEEQFYHEKEDDLNIIKQLKSDIELLKEMITKHDLCLDEIKLGNVKKQEELEFKLNNEMDQ